MNHSPKTRWQQKSSILQWNWLETFGNKACFDGDPYPILHQPLAVHPLIYRHPERRHLVLLFSAYRFVDEISDLEMSLVCELCQRVSENAIPGIDYSHELRQGALTIFMDEAYHSLVARDYKQQLIHLNEIPPIPYQQDNLIARAMQGAMYLLPNEALSIFSVFVTCMSENSITDELKLLLQSENLNTACHDMIAYHLKDEARHAVYFQEVFKTTYLQMPQRFKAYFAPWALEFTRQYVQCSRDQQYAEKILEQLSFDAPTIQKIIQDSFPMRDSLLKHPLLKGILRLFNGIEGDFHQLYDAYHHGESEAIA